MWNCCVWSSPPIDLQDTDKLFSKANGPIMLPVYYIPTKLDTVKL